MKLAFISTLLLVGCYEPMRYNPYYPPPPQDPRAVTECIESLTRDREIRTLAEQQHTTPAELARVTCEADANAGSR